MPISFGKLKNWKPSSARFSPKRLYRFIGLDDTAVLKRYFKSAGLVGLTIMTHGIQAAEAPRPPNVVFILTDDQGYPELGCHGNSVIQTPHMDALHSESVRLDQFHVGPTCAPTRAGLLTGHHANSAGVWHTIGGRSLLRKDEWTLPAALKGQGYRTGLFGKWHLGDEVPYRPQDRGFEETVCHGGGGISQSPDWWGNDYFDDTYSVNGEPKKFEGYCTDVFFEESLRFIEKHKNESFFCMIAPNAPHSPFNVPKAYQEPYRESNEPDTYQRFMAMISNIDDNLGRLRSRLKELGLAENTLLVFMSDNGTTAEAWAGRATPFRAGLRGEKGSEYDGGHRAPCFIHWPAGNLDRGVSVDAVTMHVDFMPTILDLCGVTIPTDRDFHGESLLPLLHGEKDGRWDQRILVTDSQRVTVPVKWKQSAVMKHNWRLVNGEELYNVETDPGQTRDISLKHPEMVEELRAGYETWWSEVSKQFDEEVPISLGFEEVCLNTHDWRNEDSSAAWHQGHIRQGKVCNGYWEVLVESDGDYEFELRRWPREAGHSLQAGIDGDDIEWRKAECWEPWHGAYTGGKALPIKAAHLKISGHDELTMPVDASMDRAVFTVSLQKGPAHVQTWLLDQQNFEIGAYYVYIKKHH
jgi:arylsulfatase A-like enzyme